MKLPGKLIRFTWLTALLAAALGVSSSPAWAVTPESPEVKQVIEKGLVFLQSAPEERLGGKCLIGLCFLKGGRPATHPQVQAALAACEAVAANTTESESVYSIGLAIIFLCELDADKHRASAQKLLDFLLAHQKSHGGWGYYVNQEGDTSQVQYAALGLWTAQRNGLQVPAGSVERLCNWLIRTQDPSGAWGYQGLDPGSANRVPQHEIRPSLCAAGLGSLYAADLLGFSEQMEVRPDSSIPSALRIIENKSAESKSRSPSKAIDATALRRALADGNGWFQKNFSVETQEWTHYYHYGLERYLSYRELVENRVEREPKWYNDVFAYLRRTQVANGSWAGQDNETVATGFALLCLSRSSKKAIQKAVPTFGDGVLLGGMGLPPNTADLQERNGKIVVTPLGGSVDELLAIIEDPANAELSRLAESGQTLKLEGDVTKRSGQIARLRALVSAGSYESRQIAVRTLAKVRDLDNVPILLFALTDPDVRIVREADRGLRFISRRFAGVGLPDGEPSGPELRTVQKAWKDWYLGIRPSAELLE